MTSVRTVLGDIPAKDLGVTYAHEHLVIDGGRPVQMQPDFDLSDVDAMATEVAEAAAFGLRSAVDCMPCDAGRNADKLAALARRTGINIIAPTGLHHDRFYGSAHWSHRVSVDELADLFIADIDVGIDAYDYAGPVVRRTSFRAGFIKVAGSDDGLSARDRRVFEAAAMAHRRTRAPILTHCEGGTGALEQVRCLGDHGVHASSIVLSHVDKVVDRGYHRELLGTGAFGEYDGSFRWGDGDNGTLRLLEWAVEDDLIDRILLGMDAARRGYYRVHGGAPGLTWLLDGFSAMMAERGLGDEIRRRLFVDNPARAFALAEATAPSTKGAP